MLHASWRRCQLQAAGHQVWSGKTGTARTLGMLTAPLSDTAKVNVNTGYVNSYQTLAVVVDRAYRRKMWQTLVNLIRDALYLLSLVVHACARMFGAVTGAVPWVPSWQCITSVVLALRLVLDASNNDVSFAGLGVPVCRLDSIRPSVSRTGVAPQRQQHTRQQQQQVLCCRSIKCP